MPRLDRPALCDVGRGAAEGTEDEAGTRRAASPAANLAVEDGAFCFCLFVRRDTLARVGDK